MSSLFESNSSSIIDDILSSYSHSRKGSDCYQFSSLSRAPSMYGRVRSWIFPDHQETMENFLGHPVLLKIENVGMLDKYNSKKPSIGTLYLTATHLIFVDPDNKKETWILHMQIASVEKLPLSASGSPLLIRCKTFMSVTFQMPKERDCHEVFTSLLQLSQPVHIEDLYCFRYKTDEIPKSAGWNFFDLQAEYQRMRVPNDQWSLTLINQDYELCDTYPRYLFVPSSATSAILLGSSRFRSKGRLPVLSYLHKNKAAICRCSQPLSGFSARCMEDEQMLNCVLRTNPNACYMYVVDTRPRINAMANRATGKGYENENFYENIKFQFLGIENIHVMRNSLLKVIETTELKSPSMSSFLSGIESSAWLRHIKTILDTSWFIAQAVDAGVSVLVHCSDGWDRTAQVCTIASLLLDPYYRTIQGFQAVIEKDWLSFGHKFTDRVGHLAGDPKEISPVFTQLIDCTWQLIQQYPSHFQFNERFLLTLHDHLSSCKYGTFVGNCEKDRIDLRLVERTYSLWGYLAYHSKEYFNPLYDPKGTIGLLKPSLAPQTIKLWRGMYYRFDSGVHPREDLNDLLLVSSDRALSLEDHFKYLQKQIKVCKMHLTKHREKLKEEISDLKKEPMIDNKILYDKKEEIERLSALDIPLKGTEYKLLQDNESDEEKEIIERPSEEMVSLALDWKTLRNVKECVCSTPFDHFSKKCHCWQCGEVFCTRCIDKHVPLPGHQSQSAVPVCQLCFKKITRTTSIDSP